MRLRRFIAPAVIAAAAVFGFAGPAMAGSPHFVGTPTFTTSGSTVSVTAKEAGLGDEAQIHAVLSGDAPTSGAPPPRRPTSRPRAPAPPGGRVKTGQPNSPTTATAVFQPSCSPPQTVQFQNLKLTDETNGLVAFPVPAP